MENTFEKVFLAGAGVVAVGLIALVVVAFRRKLWWGFLVLLFPPSAVVFVARYPRKSAVPLALLLAGGLMMGAPALANRFLPIDLGPRERIVEGERHLTLTGWDRKDYSVLSSKPDLVVLQMANSDVDDVVLGHLAGMSRLRELDLNTSRVTDSGLKVLGELPALRSLRLRDTAVTDAGFQDSLAKLPELSQLDLRGTKVSPEAVKAWKAAKPGRRVLQ